MPMHIKTRKDTYARAHNQVCTVYGRPWQYYDRVACSAHTGLDQYKCYMLDQPVCTESAVPVELMDGCGFTGKKV